MLGGSTLGGILVTGLIYLFIKLVIFSGYLKNPNRGEYDLLILAAFMIMPLSLFAGSFFTGYLNQPYGQKKLLKNLFLAPGIYASLTLAIFLAIDLIRSPIEVFVRNMGDIIENVILILIICLLWILSSVFGIYLGFKLRVRRQCRPPSLDL